MTIRTRSFASDDHSTPADDRSDLRSDIKHALNRASAENPSGTPDHILADYLVGCLDAFDAAVRARSDWRAESVELPALTALADDGEATS